MTMMKILSAALVASLGFATAAQAGDGTSENSGRREILQRQQQQRAVERQAGNMPQRYEQRAYEQRSYEQRRYEGRHEARRDGRYEARNDPRYVQRYDNRVYNAPRHEQRSWSGGNPAYAYSAPQYRTYSHSPRYWAGGYVPSQYRAQRYWVNDWRSRHLAAPPYGYQWVETDTGDALLMALATGLIASVVLSQY